MSHLWLQGEYPIEQAYDYIWMSNNTSSHLFTHCVCFFSFQMADNVPLIFSLLQHMSFHDYHYTTLTVNILFSKIRNKLIITKYISRFETGSVYTIFIYILIPHSQIDNQL